MTLAGTAAGLPGATTELVSASPRKALASVEEAQRTVLRSVSAVAGRERLALAEALGRVMAEDLHALSDLPPHDSAAMDGFALRSIDIAPDGSGRWLLHAGTRLAGTASSEAVPAGHCVRIMTGARMPEGCDTVVPLEMCRLVGDTVCCAPGQAVPGGHCRRRGEDVACGEAVIPAGRRLKAADLGLLASLSCAQVVVWRKPRVALLSTGDELREPGEPLDPGCIPDSNRYALRAALETMGLEVLDLGIVPDDEAALRKTLADAAGRADAVVTSASASQGDADHLATVLDDLGRVLVKGVNLRPGKPFCFGLLDNKGPRAVPLFGLPGNPVAAMVCLQVLALPALAVLMGDRFFAHRVVCVRMAAPVNKKKGRAEFPRVHLRLSAQGVLEAVPHADQGSAVLRSLAESDALLVLPEALNAVAAGDEVSALLLPG